MARVAWREAPIEWKEPTPDAPVPSWDRPATDMPVRSFADVSGVYGGGPFDPDPDPEAA
jgi:hypothetical protein